MLLPSSSSLFSCSLHFYWFFKKKSCFPQWQMKKLRSFGAFEGLNGAPGELYTNARQISLLTTLKLNSLVLFFYTQRNGCKRRKNDKKGQKNNNKKTRNNYLIEQICQRAVYFSSVYFFLCHFNSLRFF